MSINKTITKKQELEYKRKLNQSYHLCLQELFEPEPDWEDVIEDTKYTIDPIRRIPKTFHIFILDREDNIHIPDSKHTYIFKRSHFYQKSQNPQSRIKQDLMRHYNALGYFVELYKDPKINKWCLKLSWENVFIAPP